MNQRPRHVLLGHLGGNAKTNRDLPIGEVLGEAQRDRRLTFRTQLLEHHDEPGRALRLIEVPVIEGGQALELLAGFDLLAPPRGQRKRPRTGRPRSRSLGCG